MLNKKTSKKESIINLHNGGKSVAEIQQVLLLLFPNDCIPSGAVSEKIRSKINYKPYLNYFVKSIRMHII